MNEENQTEVRSVDPHSEVTQHYKLASNLP